MKLTALLILCVPLLAHAQRFPADGPPPKQTPAAECWPKEAGGVGTHYTVRAYDKGTIYSWWGCPGRQKFEAIVTRAGPMTTKDPKVIKSELSRMRVEDGYSNGHGGLLVLEKAKQLRASKPK